jgi:hypothetical protein
VRRSAPTYLGLLVATVVFGLATRWDPASFPASIVRHGGDALWAAMVFWLVALLRPTTATSRVAIIALTIALTVEASQLYQAPWIDAARATPLGALLLGQGFLWVDLLRYAAGVALAAMLDGWLTRRGGGTQSK